MHIDTFHPDIITEASATLFGAHSSAYGRIVRILDNFKASLQSVERTEGLGFLSMGIMGENTESRRWFASCFLRDAAGQMAAHMKDNKGKDIWLSETQRFGKPREEEEVFCLPAGSLIDLGLAYALVDVASPPHQLPSVHLRMPVFAYESLRDRRVRQQVFAMQGAWVLPIILYRPDRSGQLPLTLQEEVEETLTAWKEEAEDPLWIQPPLFVPDAGILGEEEARTRVQKELRALLPPLLVQLNGRTDILMDQAEHLVSQAREDILAVLKESLPRIARPMERLYQCAEKMPEAIVRELAQNPHGARSFEKTLRSGLRACSLRSLSGLFFPFKSFVGMAILTQGAWDKLIFSSLGSLPSLLALSWRSAKNAKESMLKTKSSTRISLLEKRIESLYAREMELFSHALQSVGHAESEALSLQVIGTDFLDEKSQQMLDLVIGQNLPKWRMFLMGFVSSVLFWGILSGPIIALYHRYFQALSETFVQRGEGLARYPIALGGQWFTSILLAAIPVGVLALITTLSITSKQRINRAKRQWIEGMEASIKELLEEKKLRVELFSKKLQAAQKLLSL